MRIDGWEIDIELLPGRPGHPYSLYEQQYLFESPDGEYAALLYGVTEYRMGWYVGRLALFRRSVAPVPVLVITDLWWRASTVGEPVQWLDDTMFVVSTMAYREVPLVVIDIYRDKFAIVHVNRGDRYRVHLSDGAVSLTSLVDDETKFDGWSSRLDHLKWNPLAMLNEFHQIYTESASRHGIATGPNRWERVVEMTKTAIFMSFIWSCVTVASLVVWPFLLPRWVSRKVRGRTGSS